MEGGWEMRTRTQPEKLKERDYLTDISADGPPK